MTPEMVGHRRRLTLGKHVGRHAVSQMLSDVHIEPIDTQLDVIVEKVKAIAGRGKRVTDADLYEIAESAMGIELNHKMFDLLDIAIMTGNHVIPTASVKAMVNGKEHVFSASATVRSMQHFMPSSGSRPPGSSSRSSISRRSPAVRMPCAT